MTLHGGAWRCMGVAEALLPAVRMGAVLLLPGYFQHAAGVLLPWAPCCCWVKQLRHATTPRGCRNVSLDEQRRVLMKRRGSVVGRRSILKSYTLAAGGRQAGPLAVEGVSDIRQESCKAPAAAGTLRAFSPSDVSGCRRVLANPCSPSRAF